MLPGVFRDTFALRPGDGGRGAGTGRVERVVFDSDDYPETERPVAYQHLIAAAARMTPLAEPFSVKAVFYTLGDTRLCLFDAVPHRFERSRIKLAFDKMDLIAFQHLLRGRVVGDFDGAPVRAGEGSVYGVDFAKPSTIEECGDVRLMLVCMRRKTATALLPAIGSVHGSILSREEAEPYLRRLYALVPRLETLPAEEAPGAALDLISALARSLRNAVVSSDEAGSDPGSGKRQGVLDYIEAHLADRSLTLDSIARAMGLSRTVLFAAFRDVGGVERAIISCRLRHAQALLTQSGTRLSVARAALLCGFSSPEHFARLFRHRFGTAPSRFGKVIQQ